LSRHAALEEKLGYRFSDPRLLERALTHRSHGVDHNERLEFLGDGVLGCVVADELYARYPDLAEGKLTRLRASLVREEALAEVAGLLGVAGDLRFDSRQTLMPSVLADTVEAVFGALLLDGGYPATRAAAVRAFAPLLERIDPEQVAKDAKSELQEIMNERRKKLPEYRTVATHGEPHRRSFEVECVLSDMGLTTKGSGTTLQRAQQEAARKMLERLGR